MRNSVIIFILVVLLGAVGVWSWMNSGSPATSNSGAVGNTMPVPGENTPDMVVNEDPAATGPAPSQPASATQSVKEFTLVGNNYSFSTPVISVSKGDRVRIVFKNQVGFHDLKIDEFGVATQKLQAGGTETIEFTADKTGSFEYYCSVGNHRAQGMRGTLTVR